MFRKTGKGSTAWLATTLMSAGGMIGATIYAATKAESTCYTAFESIKTFAASTLSTPVINTDITLDIPDIVSNTILPITIFVGSKMTIPVEIPSYSIKVTTLLGESTTSYLREVPDILSQICSAEVAMHGAAYTAIIVGLAALTTYAYAKNHQLSTELANRTKTNNIESAEDIESQISRPATPSRLF